MGKIELITCGVDQLEAVFALCEVHMADNAKVIDDLKARWGDDDGAV